MRKGRQMELDEEIPGGDAASEAEGRGERSGDEFSMREAARQVIPAGAAAREAEESGEEDDDARPDGAALRSSSAGFKTVLMLGSIVLCLFLAAGFLFVKFDAYRSLFARVSQRHAPTTCLVRPVPRPHYRQVLDFLLAYPVEGQEMITTIRMEVGYTSPARYRNFKERNVAFRDMVYNFLMNQNPSRNSVKSWHSVVEKSLLDYLRVEMPRGYPASIRLAQVKDF